MWPACSSFQYLGECLGTLIPDSIERHAVQYVLSVMHCMFVIPPNVYVEMLTPIESYWELRTLGSNWIYVGRPHDGIGAFIRTVECVSLSLSLSLSPC